MPGIVHARALHGGPTHVLTPATNTLQDWDKIGVESKMGSPLIPRPASEAVAAGMASIGPAKLFGEKGGEDAEGRCKAAKGDAAKGGKGAKDTEAPDAHASGAAGAAAAAPPTTTVAAATTRRRGGRQAPSPASSLQEQPAGVQPSSTASSPTSSAQPSQGPAPRRRQAAAGGGRGGKQGGGVASKQRRLTKIKEDLEVGWPLLCVAVPCLRSAQATPWTCV